MSLFLELRKIALFLARQPCIFHFLQWVLKGACKPKAHRSFSSHRGQCNPSFWIKTCEHHQDSSYSVRFSAKSGIRMHMGPGLFLHSSGCVYIFVSLLYAPFENSFILCFWRSYSLTKLPIIHTCRSLSGMNVIILGGICESLWSTMLLVSVNMHIDSFNWIMTIPYCVFFITPKRSTSKNSTHMGLWCRFRVKQTCCAR